MTVVCNEGMRGKTGRIGFSSVLSGVTAGSRMEPAAGVCKASSVIQWLCKCKTVLKEREKVLCKPFSWGSFCCQMYIIKKGWCLQEVIRSCALFSAHVLPGNEPFTSSFPNLKYLQLASHLSKALTHP